MTEQKMERVYYRVCFDNKGFSRYTFNSLQEAQDWVNSCNGLDSLQDWLKKGKSEEDWLYWQDMYNNHTHIEQVWETVYKLS